MLVLGEVRTCLLHNTTPLPARMTEQVLELIPGRRTVSEGQPVARSWSPELFSGVDCRLATSSGTKARGIGTVGARGLITAGTVVQGSVVARLEDAVVRRRLPWSHYASKAGRIEVLGDVDVPDLGRGFIADAPDPETLDLGSVGERIIAEVQAHPALDRVTLFRSRPMSLRWTAWVSDDQTAVPRAAIRVVDESTRTLQLSVDRAHIEHAARFCEDFALHDWLLATLKRVIEQSDRVKALDREPMAVLRTAVEMLLHLWMPGTRVSEALLPLWEGFERQAGLTRQWNAQVAHIRDQIALRTLQALERAGVTEPA